MTTTGTTGTSTTSTSTAAAASTTSTTLQKIGQIAEIAGGGAFLAGTILSVHHYAIGAFFIVGAAAFFAGRRMAK